MEACRTCRFFKPHGKEPEKWEGRCRRLPPQIVLVDGASTYWGEFPYVLPTSWCGEYDAAPPPSAEGGRG